MEQSPINMHLAALKYRCSLEINNYRQKKESDDRYCLEIFKRAIIDGDNEAWVALQEQFRENVLIWLRCHTKRQEALRIETEQNYIDDTFKRFWLWGNNQRFEFRSLAGALKFLNLCLNSLIIDNLRFYARSERIPLPEYRISTASTNGGPDDKRELWQAIQKILTDKRELRIVFLLYHEGLKPREIIQRCPGEFSIAHFTPFPEPENRVFQETALRVLKRLVAQPIIQKSEMILRQDPSATAWSRQYQAEDFNLLFQLSPTDNNKMKLIGFFESFSSIEQFKALEGVVADLYHTSALPLNERGQFDKSTEEPVMSTTVDELGNFAFSPILPGNYIAIIHLPDIELVVEGLYIT